MCVRVWHAWLQRPQEYALTRENATYETPVYGAYLVLLTSAAGLAVVRRTYSNSMISLCASAHPYRELDVAHAAGAYAVLVPLNCAKAGIAFTGRPSSWNSDLTRAGTDSFSEFVLIFLVMLPVTPLLVVYGEEYPLPKSHAYDAT